MAVGGIACIAGGYHVYHKDGSDETAILFPFGILITPAVIVTWMIGAGRKSRLKKTPYYTNRYQGALHISPMIRPDQFNANYSYGMSLSFTF